MLSRTHLPTAVVALALLASACGGGGSGSDDPLGAVPPSADQSPSPAAASPDEVLEEFVTEWADADWSALAALVFDTDTVADPVALHTDVYAELQVTSTTIEVQSFAVDGRRATADIVVTLGLDRLGDWTYPSTVELVEVDSRWWVEWSPATLHPALREARSFERLRIWPQRGKLLAWDGTALRTDLPVVDVGFEPQRIEDREAEVAELARALDLAAETIDAVLDAPGVQPDWFVRVATLREQDYRAVALTVVSLPGVVTRDRTERLGPTDGYAQQVLGATAPITAEQLEQLGEPYDVFSTVGRSGLELVYESELAGSPSGEIRLLDSTGTLLSVAHRFSGRRPVDIVTTLDVAMQAAAETTLDETTEPAAFVAIDAATGEIRAVVSRPTDEFGRALAGSYPPGSTFKTVTASAFIEQGASAGTSVSCPTRVVVDGFPFTNAGGSSLGAVSLSTAYARSCNTAFVNVSTMLEPGSLEVTAAEFGFGVAYNVGLTTAGGSIPEPVDDAELAASAIGQGRVIASPLHMASVAAAVADGTWRAPALVLDPLPEQVVALVKLSDDVTATMQSLMRRAITNGTGSAVAGAGSDISGKTGSAEFGDEDPPQTHAWFIGYRDGLALAVLVEGGGGGGSVAAPLAANFLALLDG